MSKPLNLVILGSCVTRDAIELLGDRPWELNKYMARTGLGSFFGPRTNSVHPDFSVFSSSFRRRTVEEDLTKAGAAWLENADFDILIYDPIDERYPMAVFPDGGVCTLSAEFSELAVPASSYREVPAGSEEFWDAWTRGWDQLVGMLRERNMVDRLLVHHAPWTTRISGSDSVRFDQPRIHKHNEWIDRAMEHVRSTIPAEQVIRVDERLHLSDPDHKWGATPYHYIEDYSHDLLRRIDESSHVIEVLGESQQTVTGVSTHDLGVDKRETLDQYLARPTDMVGPWREIHQPLGDGLFLDGLLAYRDDGLPTVVLLPSAQSLASRRNPLYVRNSWVDEFLEANVIVLSDPGLYVADEVLGSWFVSEDVPVADRVAAALMSIHRAWNGTDRGLVFYGSAMGAFEAVQLAGRVPGAVAVAEIPQTDLRTYTDPDALAGVAICAGGKSVYDPSVETQVDMASYLRSLECLPRIHFVTNVFDPTYADIKLMADEFGGAVGEDDDAVVLTVSRSVRGHVPMLRPEAAQIVRGEITRLQESNSAAAPFRPHGRVNEQLFRGRLTIRDIVAFSLPVPMQSLVLLGQMESGNINPHSALISLELHGEGDVEVDTAMEEAHGVVRSPSPHVGWFSYMNTRPGLQTTEMPVTLPPGVTCTGVRIIRWAGGDLDPDLLSLAVRGVAAAQPESK
ncbi:DUF6270 domain-containing protein [Luteococcus sp.]|uniref:DUF6270 domain-containing protein n=1 Tax=Luteococcus sp. TaxID=1969402 RepID=UPI00373602B8